MAKAGTPVPVVVIGGYLGSGKTTLVNHLLRHAGGRRIAVLVNDFGDISIDADLIAGDAADGVIALAGGCVCCSFGADLVGTLCQVLWRDPRPDVVLVECSGVGLPAAVARSAALAPGGVVDGIVVIADAAELRRQAADRFVGETVMQQLRQADLLVLNQVDRAGAEAGAAVARWLREQAPDIPQMACVHAALPVEAVLGLAARDVPVDEAAAARWSAEAGHWATQTAPAVQRFWFFTRRLDEAVDLDSLRAELAAVASGLLRAKGFVRGADGRVWLVQAVGRRVQMEPAVDPRPGVVGRLACIALAAPRRVPG